MVGGTRIEVPLLLWRLLERHGLKVLAEDVEEGLLPATVEGRVDVEDERDQRTDVLDRHGLRMEVEED